MNNEKVVLNKTKVQQALAKDFVFIKLYTNTGTDAHKEAVRALRNRFLGPANPWYVLLTADEVQIKRWGGQLTVEGFLADLAMAKAKSGRTAKAK